MRTGGSLRRVPWTWSQRASKAITKKASVSASSATSLPALHRQPQWPQASGSHICFGPRTRRSSVSAVIEKCPTRRLHAPARHLIWSGTEHKPVCLPDYLSLLKLIRELLGDSLRQRITQCVDLFDHRVPHVRLMGPILLRRGLDGHHVLLHMGHQEPVHRGFREIRVRRAHEGGDLGGILHERIQRSFLERGIASKSIRKRSTHVLFHSRIVADEQRGELLSRRLAIEGTDRESDGLGVCETILIGFAYGRLLAEPGRQDERSYPEDMVNVEVPQGHFHTGDLGGIGHGLALYRVRGRRDKYAEQDERAYRQPDHSHTTLAPLPRLRLASDYALRVTGGSISGNGAVTRLARKRRTQPGFLLCRRNGDCGDAPNVLICGGLRAMATLRRSASCG